MSSKDSEIARLRVQVAELQELLRSEWEENHARHCGETHAPGDPREMCAYPLPEVARSER